MRRNIMAALCCTLMLAACASRPPAAIGEDAVYRLEVTNSLTHPMTVSVDLGANQQAVLGQVDAGATRTFEIRDPSTNDINLRATHEGSNHVFERKVELSRSNPARVTLK